MPEIKTIERARKDAREGKAPTTQAGEFVREEIEHIRRGEHGARSTKQAIAIGLSKARKAGVHLPPPKNSASAKFGSNQARATRTSGKRSRVISRVLKGEPHAVTSHKALSKQAKEVARRRGRKARKRSARKAVRTKIARTRRVA